MRIRATPCHLHPQTRPAAQAKPAPLPLPLPPTPSTPLTTAPDAPRDAPRSRLSEDAPRATNQAPVVRGKPADPAPTAPQPLPTPAPPGLVILREGDKRPPRPDTVTPLHLVTHTEDDGPLGGFSAWGTDAAASGALLTDHLQEALVVRVHMPPAEAAMAARSAHQVWQWQEGGGGGTEEDDPKGEVVLEQHECGTAVGAGWGGRGSPWKRAEWGERSEAGGEREGWRSGRMDAMVRERLR